MTKARRRFCGLAMLLLLFVPSAAWAGFASTEVFLPAVGRISGNGGAQFFTTVWATNLTGVAETFKFEFLKQGQANGSPASFQDTLQPGETKVYENVVETKLGLTSAIGAARVTSSGEIFVSERIFDQAPGADLGDTQGLFFAGVPKNFSISIGQSASIQGLNQGGAENFRYNFALVETGGGSPTVNVQVFDGSGGQLGQKSFTLSPFEQLQPNVSEVVPGFSSINARLAATVTGGSGSVLLAGAQLANISQDSSGFEMTFRDDLLGAGAGVTSLNGLAGALTLTPGNGISITPSGSSIAIAFTGGGGSGLASVTHDASLAGAGTGASPLAIANGQVVRSLNGLHDAVTLSAGSNVTITPSGSILTIATSGGGGPSPVTHDSTLTGDGTGAVPLGVAVPLNLQSTNASALTIATTANSGAPAALSVALSGATSGKASGISITVDGSLTNNDATAIHASVGGDVRGIVVVSQSSPAVVGQSQTGGGAVEGFNKSTAVDSAGVFGGDGTGSTDISNVSSAGVRGESGTNIGVLGVSQNFGVIGILKSGAQGELASHRENHDFGLYTTSDIKAAAATFTGNVVTMGNAAVSGNLFVVGTITAGTKDFKIDHPLEPEERYLVHASIESNEMKNIYDGIATFNDSGLAIVELPRWFEALNERFRYQLTAIGAPQPGLYVAREIHENRFTIGGGVPGASVSWQVSGVRRDPYARAHPLIVEESKASADRGHYLHPDAFGQPAEKRVHTPDPGEAPPVVEADGPSMR